jgi:hypothetical protein
MLEFVIGVLLTLALCFCWLLGEAMNCLISSKR